MKIQSLNGLIWGAQGQYMTEAAAKAAGGRPDHGKGCS